LPPVVAGQPPGGAEVLDGAADRRGETRIRRTIEKSRQRPQPGAVAVQLEVPPAVGTVEAVKGVSRWQETVRCDLGPRGEGGDDLVDAVGAVGDDAGRP